MHVFVRRFEPWWDSHPCAWAASRLLAQLRRLIAARCPIELERTTNGL